MKTNKNTLYRVEDKETNGKLIETDGTITQNGYTAVELSETNSRQAVSILESGITTNGHLCISVYRDAIIVDDIIYNICLSCGDFYKNNEHFYLSKEARDTFTNFKNEYFTQAMKSVNILTT